MPCGRNVRMWVVGGLDVKANFVPKIDIVGLVRIALLDGREPLSKGRDICAHALSCCQIFLARSFSIFSVAEEPHAQKWLPLPK